MDHSHYPNLVMLRMKKTCLIFPFLILITFTCRQNRPVDYVDPFICTNGDNGQLYPGASYPFGMVQLSPETEGDSHVGYYYEDLFIEGFSHLRIPGAGSRGKGGGILIKPGIGKFTNSIVGFREKYVKQSEEASAGYYKVTLESGVKAELTVSKRIGFHRYTFPKETKKERYIVIDLSHSYVGMLDAALNVKSNHEITGMIKSLHNSAGGYHIIYFAIVSDVSFDSYLSWEGSESGRVPMRNGNNIGVWLNLPGDGKEIVQLKVGLSPVNEEMAMMEATSESKGWSFDEVWANTASEWNSKLAKIQIKGGSDELKTIFYTHLYHSYLVPNISSSSTGVYRACNQPDSLYRTENTAADFTFYSTWSLWDDFRKYSLVSLMEPQIATNIARSLVDYYKHRDGGDRNYWPTPNIRMEFAGAVILDAYNKGLADFSQQAAWTGMMQDYERYMTHNVSKKLEKAYHAYCAKEMAQIIDNPDDVRTLEKASLAYRDLWCSGQKDNQGNIRGFFTPDGNPVTDVETIDAYGDEGNLWHYRWFVLHDVKGLVDLAGGPEKTADDLEYFFEHDLYMHLNEPDYHAPFLFNYLGKAHLTQKWARTFTTEEVTQRYHNHGLFEKPVVARIYRADTKGYIETMDDDAGAMSSWFVMSAMGLFPYNPVEAIYQIGSPIFPELILHLDNGKKFRMVAKNVSQDRFYIQSAELNGKEFDQSWIGYKSIMEGGTLEFQMGSRPNRYWGCRKDNRSDERN